MRDKLTVNKRISIPEEYIQYYLNNILQFMQKPTGELAVVNIAPFCNQECVFCLEDKNTNYLSTTQVKKMIDSLIKDVGISVINYMGGESTLRPDFQEILEYSKSKNLNVVIATNASKFKDLEYTKKIIPLLDGMELSFHAPDKKTFQLISGRDSYYNFIQSLKNIKTVISDLDFDLPIRFNIVINKYNFNLLEEIVKKIRSFDFPKICLSLRSIFITGRALKNKNIIPRHSHVKKHLDSVIRYCIKEKIPFILEGFPFCVVPEYYIFSRDGVNQIHDERFINHNKSSMHGNEKWDDCWISNRHYYHPKICASCSLSGNCPGIQSEYIKLYGLDELTPMIETNKFHNLFFDNANVQEQHEKKEIKKDNCVFEKKKWISITGLCNNNCLFCLDKDRLDKFHKESTQIKREIKKAKKQGNTKLILSGGDPTIHPDIMEFVKYAKELNYNKIQIITNGRMFASKEFTDEIIAAGLDEVTFSIHGYNSKMHDSLTRVPGSFKQILKGVKNVFSSHKKIIVNTDTCITKLNYKYLPIIIKFIVEKLGINEVNLMSMVPQGNAWTYKDQILYDYKTVAPYVHKVLDYCTAKGVVLWLSRFPAEYLEGYEDFIEDAYKIVDDVRGSSKRIFNNEKPPCIGEKCKYCGINAICDDILAIKKLSKNQNKKQSDSNYKIIEINKDNYTKLPDSTNIVIKYPYPKRRLADCEKTFISFDELRPFLIKLKKSKFKDIPPCIVDKDRIISNVLHFKKSYMVNGKLDYVKIAEDLTLKLKIKRLSCKKCKYHEDCEGVYQNYIRLFGFKEFKPLTDLASNHIDNNNASKILGKLCKIADFFEELGYSYEDYCIYDFEMLGVACGVKKSKIADNFGYINIAVDDKLNLLSNSIKSRIFKDNELNSRLIKLMSELDMDVDLCSSISKKQYRAFKIYSKKINFDLSVIELECKKLKQRDSSWSQKRKQRTLDFLREFKSIPNLDDHILNKLNEFENIISSKRFKFLDNSPKKNVNLNILKGNVLVKKNLLIRGKISSNLSYNPKEVSILLSKEFRPRDLQKITKADLCIAEEGGICSHAAILCRELGKDCIMGVKNATKLLSEGDFIEANMNTGEIKILMRN